MLRRHLGSVSDVTYKFPSQFTLQAGQQVTVGSTFVELAQSSVLMLNSNIHVIRKTELILQVLKELKLLF